MEGIPEHWPDYINRSLKNLPRCWSQEDDVNAHRHKFSGNLLAAFIRTQQASVYLERAREQAEFDLRRARELRKNYSDQSRLMVTTHEAQKKAKERVGLLEATNVGLMQRVAELEEQVRAGEDRCKAEVDGVRVAMARLEEEITFLKADFEFKADVNANFAYYKAFADAIRAHRRDDPSGDISGMVNELKAYVQDNPPDRSLLLDIKDLSKLGVDLSFFPDPDQIISPKASELGDTTELVIGTEVVVDTEQIVTSGGGAEQQVDSAGIVGREVSAGGGAPGDDVANLQADEA